MAMYIESVPNRNSPPAVLLRETWWDKDAKKVRKRTLANLSRLPPELVEEIRACLRGAAARPLDEAFEIASSLPHGAVAAALGTLRKTGLDRIVSPRPSRQRDLVVAMVVARITAPRAKLATARGLSPESACDTLGQTLGVADADENELYGAMDWLLARQGRIETELARRHLGERSLVLWDLTSVWMEGRSCTLARFGHSRDGRKGKLQVEFGLMCDREGRPVAVEVFEGNASDPSTVATAAGRLRDRFGLDRVVLVGDRGMLTDARLREDVRPAGLDWITALRATAIRALAENGALQPSLFDDMDMAEIACEELFPGERLTVCRNPLLAEERTRRRQDLLQATEKGIREVEAATRRRKNRLKGATKIALRLEKVLASRKMRKHFVVDVREDGFSWRRNAESIAAEEALDGFYVVRTSLPESVMAAGETVRAYKSLARVERAFRTMKTVDLKVRPVHHRLAGRVRAHVLLCMLAYYVEWHMREALKPLLFHDEEPLPATSPVAPAEPSDGAALKAATKRTTSGLPAQGFQGLMAHLATLSRLRVKPKSESAAEFEMTSTPTPLQAEAFRLLGVRLS